MRELLYKIYHVLPKSIRYGRKYATEYNKVYNGLKRSEYYNKEQLDALQFRELRKIVQYAYKKVPYYTELFDKLNLDVMGDFSLELFKKIPYLTKDIVRKNTEDLISKDFQKSDLVAHSTGGSTGEPCVFYYEKDIAEAREYAFVQHLYDRVGYKDDDSKVYFRDFSSDKITPSANVYWYKKTGEPTWWFSVRFLDENRMDFYIKQLIGINPMWIVGYPSAINTFCTYVKGINAHLGLNKLKGVILMSENVYSYQLQNIKDVFGKCNKELRLFSAYGHTEHGCIAGTCEKEFVYHIQPEYGYCEFDNGELIATGFTNYAMPLIRYRTQDLFTLSDAKCECGRHYQLIASIDGRTDDVLVHSDGRYENANTLDFTRGRLAELIDMLLRYQFIQYKKGECIMRIIAKKVITEDQLKELEKEINQYFGETLHVAIEKAEKPILGKSGKERLIINKSNR